MPDAAPQPAFIVSGLDLGQSMDFSCLIALAGFVGAETRYVARGLKRWPLGTRYTQIVADLKRLYSAPPLAGSELGVDRTGCGQPVVDMIVEARVGAEVRPVLITAGADSTHDGAGFRVPKRELCATVGVLLQSGRLELPETLPERDVLAKELLAFKAKITATGTETFEADWRMKAHDDMVLALAIAAWLGERREPVCDVQAAFAFKRAPRPWEV